MNDEEYQKYYNLINLYWLKGEDKNPPHWAYWKTYNYEYDAVYCHFCQDNVFVNRRTDQDCYAIIIIHGLSHCPQLQNLKLFI